jgi:ABC-type multidrug transport system fused ATPase/permease subunit
MEARMPVMQLLILKIPFFILGMIVVGGFAAFAVAGVLIVRRFIDHSRLRTHHDVADPILGALATVCAVLLAFVVVTVWQGFDKTNASVQLEANYLADIYRDSEALPADFHQKAGELLREYRQAVVEHEWKTMAEGEMSPEVERLMRRIWSLYTNYQPKTPTEQSFFDESVRKLNSFRELRRQRLMDSRTGLSPLLWFVLIVGCLSTISFTFLFGAENLQAQIIMVVLLAVTIALILFTIMEMDFPFTGGVSISPEPFKMILLD